jgi:hypothetical protein
MRTANFSHFDKDETFSTSRSHRLKSFSPRRLNVGMSYLAYPPRLPIEFSENVAQLIELTLKIKNEVAINKNEFIAQLAKAGRAPKSFRSIPDARTSLLGKQNRASRIWVSISGLPKWDKAAEIEPSDKFALQADLLRNLEKLFLTLQTGTICPLTKVTTLQKVLARRPVLSIRQLAEDGFVSESTAKRWLKKLEMRGVLSSHLKDGQRQFVNEGLIEIMNRYV